MQDLLDVMKKVAKQPDGIVPKLLFGTITSINPVELLVDGMPTPIPPECIYVGAMCRRYVIPQPHIHYDVAPDTATTSKETQEIELWRGLRIGDRVSCIRVNNGQMYYITQRYEMEGFR